MKVLGFSGSPRGKMGITDRLLQIFLEGAREAGAEAETIYVAKKKINYCKGCFHCWFVTPGKCIQKDDMEEIKEKYGKADIVVFGSPVYVDGFTSQMKTVLDRFISGGSPFIEFRDGHSRHTTIDGKPKKKKRKLLLLSTCGFGEKDNFEPMKIHFRAIVKNFGEEYIGSLVIPMGGSLDLMKDEVPEKVESIYKALRQSGFDAVSKGEISDELQNVVSAPLLTVKEYTSRLNKLFKENINENKQK